MLEVEKHYKNLKMKNRVLIFVFLTGITGLYAQTDEELGKIALSVVMPEYVEGLDVSQLSRLQTKITQIVTGAGLASSGFDQNFVIYPTFTIYESSVVESGIQDITVLNCEIALIIKDYENNVIFSSVTKSLKGSGKSKSQAITSALSKMNVSDPDFKTFITTGKNRIVDYFNTKCDIIIQNAFALVKQERFDEAIYNLTSVPEICEDCYFRCLDTLDVIYTLKINGECRDYLQDARIIWAASQTSEGAEKVVSLISSINPLADCQKDVDKLIKEIYDKLRSDQKANWQFKMKQYQDSVAAQRARWDFEVKKYFNDSDRYKNGSTVEININTEKVQPEKVRPADLQQIGNNDNKDTNTVNEQVNSQNTQRASGAKVENVSNQNTQRDSGAKVENVSNQNTQRDSGAKVENVSNQNTQRASGAKVENVSNQNTQRASGGKVENVSNQNTQRASGAKVENVSNQNAQRASGTKVENVSNQLSYKERKARRNQNLDNMRVKEYRNVGMAYAQNKPKRMNYNSVSRK
jgi:hypothetical protein